MEILPKSLHGAYQRQQLVDRLGRKGLERAVAEGRLISYSRNVLVAREHMLNFRTRCAAALLLAGSNAVLSHETSAFLYGCTAASQDPIHVLKPYGRKLRPRPGLVVHQGQFEVADISEVDGLRCLVLDATITELLCRGDRATALACADQALAFASAAERAEIKADIACRIAERTDSRGRQQGSFLLDLATGLPESPPESWLLLKIVDAGLPVPEPQFVVRDINGREIWRLDFAWPDARLALEYDGYAAHAEKGDADASRDEDLRRRGWTVIRADVSDLRDPTRLLARLNGQLRGAERATRGGA
jgi:hypothetical protein